METTDWENNYNGFGMQHDQYSFLPSIQHGIETCHNTHFDRGFSAVARFMFDFFGNSLQQALVLDSFAGLEVTIDLVG